MELKLFLVAMLFAITGCGDFSRIEDDGANLTIRVIGGYELQPIATFNNVPGWMSEFFSTGPNSMLSPLSLVAYPKKEIGIALPNGEKHDKAIPNNGQVTVQGELPLGEEIKIGAFAMRNPSNPNTIKYHVSLDTFVVDDSGAVEKTMNLGSNKAHTYNAIFCKPDTTSMIGTTCSGGSGAYDYVKVSLGPAQSNCLGSVGTGGLQVPNVQTEPDPDVLGGGSLITIRGFDSTACSGFSGKKGVNSSQIECSGSACAVLTLDSSN